MIRLPIILQDGTLTWLETRDTPGNRLFREYLINAQSLGDKLENHK